MAQAIRDSIDSYRVYRERVRELNSKKKKALKAIGTFTTEAKGRGKEAEKVGK